MKEAALWTCTYLNNFKEFTSVSSSRLFYGEFPLNRRSLICYNISITKIRVTTHSKCIKVSSLTTIRGFIFFTCIEHGSGNLLVNEKVCLYHVVNLMAGSAFLHLWYIRILYQVNFPTCQYNRPKEERMQKFSLKNKHKNRNNPALGTGKMRQASDRTKTSFLWIYAIQLNGML